MFFPQIFDYFHGFHGNGPYSSRSRYVETLVFVASLLLLFLWALRALLRFRTASARIKRLICQLRCLPLSRRPNWMIFQFHLFACLAATLLTIEWFWPEWNNVFSSLLRWPAQCGPLRISGAGRMFEQDAAGFNVNSVMSWSFLINTQDSLAVSKEQLVSLCRLHVYTTQEFNIWTVQSESFCFHMLKQRMHKWYSQSHLWH